MVEGQLPPDEQADLIDHMSDCETCYKIYTELLLVGEDLDAEPVPAARTARAAKAPPAAEAASSKPAESPPRSRWAAAAAALKSMFRRGSG